MILDDATLIERCRQGDALAWEGLVRRHQGRVYSIALHTLRDAEDARDAAQEVFIRLYERLDTCTNDETFVPWLARMTRNHCIDRIRRAKARPKGGPVPVEEMYDLADAGLDPHEQYKSNARRNLIHRAMMRLSKVNREILLLKDIQGWTLEEIASALGVPLGTVKSRSNRARIELAGEVVKLRKESPGAMEGGAS